MFRRGRDFPKLVFLVRANGVTATTVAQIEFNKSSAAFNETISVFETQKLALVNSHLASKNNQHTTNPFWQAKLYNSLIRRVRLRHFYQGQRNEIPNG